MIWTTCLSKLSILRSLLFILSLTLLTSFRKASSISSVSLKSSLKSLLPIPPTVRFEISSTFSDSLINWEFIFSTSPLLTPLLPDPDESEVADVFCESILNASVVSAILWFKSLMFPFISLTISLLLRISSLSTRIWSSNLSAEFFNSLNSFAKFSSPRPSITEIVLCIAFRSLSNMISFFSTSISISLLSELRSSIFPSRESILFLRLSVLNISTLYPNFIPSFKSEKSKPSVNIILYIYYLYLFPAMTFSFTPFQPYIPYTDHKYNQAKLP